MGKDSAPAPDYKSAAEETAAGNMEMAKYTTQANRINQYNPWGSQTYTNNQTFDQDGYDKALSEYEANRQQQQFGGVLYGSAPATMPDRADYTKDNWSQTLTLDPKIQEALDSQINMQTQRSHYANDMLGRVKDSYANPFDGPELSRYLQSVQGLDQSQLKSSDYTNGGPGLDYNAPDLAQFLKGVPALDYNSPDSASYLAGVKTLDQDAPRLDTEAYRRYSDAAFNTANSYLAPQYQKQEQALRDQLALQGLNPMSQASNNATGSFYDGKNQAYNQLANQSILTGNTMANNDYSSQLAGFQATNAARTQALNNGLGAYGAASNTWAQNNAVRQQAYQNALSNYSGALQGYGAQNATRQQGITNGQNAFNLDLSSQSQANTARNQAYAQALARHQTDYQQAVNQRNMPLNEMNALLTGEQVQAPQFGAYPLQQQVAGPDYTQAATSGYEAALGNANASNAGTNAGIGAVATIAAAFL